MLLQNISGGLKRLNVGYRVFPSCCVYMYPARRYYSEHDRDKPVKFTTSQAAKWRAEYTRTGHTSRIPTAQPFIVNLSFVIFMLYFCILREESDIDQKLSGMNLYDKVEGLEEASLRAAIIYNENNGLDTTELQRRLDEITEK